jgi:hypothetical protein
MIDYDKYFNEQIQHSESYFNKWLYTSESKILTHKGEPIKKTVYCELDDTFSNYHSSKIDNEHGIAHNCLSCNFKEGAKNIELFFEYNKNTNSRRYFLTLYSLMFYLQAERLGVIYKELGFNIEYKGESKFNWTAFPKLQRIKYWANFFKHPKYYMLLHHPMFFIEGDPYTPNLIINGIIDDAFIHKFYSGGKSNKDLRAELENKNNFIIIFPNLLNLTIDLCSEFEKIVTLITNDKETIAKLATYTTIKDDLTD